MTVLQTVSQVVTRSDLYEIVGQPQRSTPHTGTQTRVVTGTVDITCVGTQTIRETGFITVVVTGLQTV